MEKESFSDYDEGKEGERREEDAESSLVLFYKPTNSSKVSLASFPFGH